MLGVERKTYPLDTTWVSQVVSVVMKLKVTFNFFFPFFLLVLLFYPLSTFNTDWQATKERERENVLMKRQFELMALN